MRTAHLSLRSVIYWHALFAALGILVLIGYLYVTGTSVGGVNAADMTAMVSFSAPETAAGGESLRERILDSPAVPQGIRNKF